MNRAIEKASDPARLTARDVVVGVDIAFSLVVMLIGLMGLLWCWGEWSSMKRPRR